MMYRIFAGLLPLALPFSASAQEKVLRAVMHADVRVIDPIWTTQTIANIHGALVYDTLFGNDADQKPHPQMVGKYEVSPDRLTYTFTLRDGLKFHAGTPVTTKDVRSEEHTSELQSPCNLVCRLLLEKKKTIP